MEGKLFVFEKFSVSADYVYVCEDSVSMKFPALPFSRSSESHSDNLALMQRVISLPLCTICLRASEMLNGAA